MFKTWVRRRETVRPGRRRGLFLAAFFALLAAAPAARAETPPPSPAGERVELLAASAPTPERTMLFGLRMTMREGWHTYWRKPGDSGIAPRFDWSASENVAEVRLLWPVPERFDVEGDMTAGYAREVIWPVLVRAADAARPVKLDLKMSYGVCSDICVPGEAHLTLARTNRDDGAAIRAYLARVPAAPENESDVAARLKGGTLHVTLKSVAETPALIVEGPRGVWFGKPQAARSSGGIDYAVPVEIAEGARLEGAEIVLTFSGPATAIEATRKVE